MKRAVMLGALCLCCWAAIAENPTERPTTKPIEKLVFLNSGFAISPLDEPGKGTHLLLSMFLPASGGFSPNVNVQSQEYSGTIDEYVTMSLHGLKESKFDLISNSKPSKDRVVCEYTGLMNGKVLHFYANAVMKDRTVFLVTATALEDQWKGASEKLRSCVDSLEPVHRQPKPE